VIRPPSGAHHEDMTSVALGENGSERLLEAAPIAVPARSAATDARLRAMLDEHFDFIWRSLRRFGLSDDRADDAAQQVFVVAARKLSSINPGSERSFLFGTALRVASDLRRSASYRREVPCEDAGLDLESELRTDDLVDRHRARALLDAMLEAMDLELRTVFVLFEIEEMTTGEISDVLGIPHGTVASRLRRAREEFRARVARHSASQRERGGGG
jgi:RNA polymerase sigma-70 factor, ECF subfamily